MIQIDWDLAEEQLASVQSRGQPRVRREDLHSLNGPGFGFLTSRAPLGAPAPPGTGFPRLRPPRVESWRVSCGAQVAGKDGGGVFWAAFKGVRVDLFKGASEESVKISIVF